MQRDVRWTNFNTLTWKQKVKKHNYDVMLGHEVSYKSTEYLLGEAMGFPFDQMENDNMGLGATPSKVESTYYDKTLLSFYLQQQYVPMVLRYSHQIRNGDSSLLSLQRGVYQKKHS